MEIEPPANAYAFVAAMYLKQEPPQRGATTRRADATVAGRNNQPAAPPRRASRRRRRSRTSCRMKVWCGRVMQSVAPTKYELYDPDTYQTINYLYTTAPNLDLSRYVNMRIIVTGEEGLDRAGETAAHHHPEHPGDFHQCRQTR